MLLSARDLFMGVVAALLAAFAGLHRLAVDATGAGRGGAAGLLADLLPQRFMNVFQGAVVTPLIEVAPYRTLGWEVLRQIAPLTSRLEKVEDRVQHVTHGSRARSATGKDRDKGLDQGPLFVREVGGITSLHPSDL